MPKKRIETRAMVIGVNAGALQRRSAGRIRRALAELSALSVEWDEINSGVSYDADALIRQIEDFQAELAGDINAWLVEPWDDGNG